MISLIRLKDGTEILCVVQEQTNTDMVIVDPLQINYRMVAAQAAPAVSLSRFMPFAADPVFLINQSDILDVARARDSVAQYYEYTLENFIRDLDARIDEEMMRSSMTEDEEAAMDSDDAYTKLLEKFEPNGSLQ